MSAHRARCLVVGTEPRTHESRWAVGEKGALTADFNGALEAGRSITAVTWTNTGPIALSAPTLAGDVIQTTVMALGRGQADIEAAVTLDNGDKRVQRFVLRVA